MFIKTLRAAVTLAVAASAFAAVAPTAHADYQPPTELLGDGPTPIPLKNAAMILRTDGGYRYIAGQQNSRLRVDLTKTGKLRYRDTGTKELRDIPGTCKRKKRAVGIAALCQVPAEYNDGNRMYLEIWPRLGNDYIDASRVPAMFRMWVLADRGNDTVLTGAGDDFVNGAQDNDSVSGGAGNDWIRTGTGDDAIWGGSGTDKLVGADGNDTIYGGEGDDSLYGSGGNDQLFTEAGADRAVCSSGVDVVHADGNDTVYGSDCETIYGR